ncbi:MAG: hypothetical protein SFU84_15315 [Gemmatimonadales bacterium]|nr:hypothetical protein [Gemmatimonadales bacterium]
MLGMLAACGRTADEVVPSTATAADPLPATAPLLRSSSDEPTCPTCDIVLDSLFTVGFSDDTVFPLVPASVVQGADQQFYIHPMSDQLKIGRYDWKGALTLLFGGQGEAPGQYGSAGTLAAAPDSQLLLVEYRKVHWYDLQTLESSAEPVPMPLNQPALIAFSGRRFLATTTGGVGMSGEIYLSTPNPGGLVLGRSTAPTVPNTATVGGASMFRHVTGRVPGEFYTIGWFLAPTLERWTTSGGLRDRVELPAPWFVPYGVEALIERDAKPRAAPLAGTTSLWQDGSQRVWTVTRVPDPRTIGLPPPKVVSDADAHRGVQAEETLAPNQRADAVIAAYEISDSSVSLLTSKRFDQRVLGFLSDSIVVERSFPEPGLARFVVYRLRLVRGRRDGR